MKINKKLPALLLAGVIAFGGGTLPQNIPCNTEIVQAASISRKSLTMKVGEKTKLKVKGTNKKAKWSSNNKEVATVNKNGRVTAVSEGVAVIAAKVGKKKYKCNVTVEADNQYTEKTVSVYRESLTSNETATIRMYGDIPYMKIDAFYNDLYFTGAEAYQQQASPMTVTRNGSVYETTAYDGTKGVFDAEKDTFVCKNLDKFANPPYYALLLASERDPSAPFVRISHTEYSGTLTAKAMDFGKYNIDLVGDGDELWVPLAALQSLFSSPFAYNAFFNGKAIYMQDGMETLQPVSARMTDSEYYVFMESPRSEEKARFDYNVLCFYVDNCFGFPARSRLSASIAEVGLDKTLDKTIDDINLPAIKEYLLSADMEEYVYGLYALLTAVDDGGHTTFADIPLMTEERKAAWAQKNAELGIVPSEKTAYAAVSFTGIVSVISSIPKDSFDLNEDITYDNGEWGKYYEKGDTAMYLFTQFYCNRLGWTRYEDGQTTEMPEDSMGTFMKCLEKAKSNPNIKKFVIFLPLNTGGESGIATTMAKIISGQAYRHQYDAYTGQDETIYYDVDLNFDGVFDEKDNEISYPFQFAVIAGATTYSAANYLTSMAKDNGICVMGEQSGGGACSPQPTPESEGTMFNLSGRYSLLDKNNEHVDFGIVPDYLLTQEKDGEVDYSRFFDFAEISRLIEEYYK